MTTGPTRSYPVWLIAIAVARHAGMPKDNSPANSEDERYEKAQADIAAGFMRRPGVLIPIDIMKAAVAKWHGREAGGVQ